MGRAESLSAIFFLASISAYQKAIVQAKSMGEYNLKYNLDKNYFID